MTKVEKRKWGLRLRVGEERRENKPFIFYRGYEEGKKEKLNWCAL